MGYGFGVDADADVQDHGLLIVHILLSTFFECNSSLQCIV